MLGFPAAFASGDIVIGAIVWKSQRVLVIIEVGHSLLKNKFAKDLRAQVDAIDTTVTFTTGSWRANGSQALEIRVRSSCSVLEPSSR